eukprot:CAMPEP_0178405922 /NCGR_PEP_ID=MMETSP0689_2-20121128/18649_1 /TAXON_ID=160604 /ORGANISM="Amphidinium massartii, Strain CS-259" /LENGTH=71 /DNA_ID=CAMNT_0020026953 /DNA_START=464 /DNA_END=679 /DNA_ORIENTATION=+
MNCCGPPYQQRPQDAMANERCTSHVAPGSAVENWDNTSVLKRKTVEVQPETRNGCSPHFWLKVWILEDDLC